MMKSRKHEARRQARRPWTYIELPTVIYCDEAGFVRVVQGMTQLLESRTAAAKQQMSERRLGRNAYRRHILDVALANPH